VVTAEEEVVNAKRAIVQELQVESELGITEALPALQDAMTILETLPVADIAALRGTKNPPKNLKLLMEAICVMKVTKYKLIF
jgi:dynein heavy chain